MKTIVFDADVWLAFFNRERQKPNYSHMLTYMQEADSGKVVIVFGAHGIAELQYAKNQGVSHRDMISYLMGHPYVWVVPVDHRIGVLAAEMGHRLKLKPMDALHLAVAIEYQAESLFTWDDRFIRKCRNAQNLTVRVSVPEHPAPRMF